MQASHRVVTILGGVAACLVGDEAPGEALAKVHALLYEALEADVFFHYLLDECSSETICLTASGDLSSQPARASRTLGFGQYLCGEVARSRVPMVLADMQHDAPERAVRAVAMGLQCYAGFPLLADGTLLGTLAFGSRIRRAFTDADVQLLQAVADILAGRQHRARLSQQRMAAETSLADSHRRLQLALRAAGNIGTFVLDLSSGIVTGDAHFAALFGVMQREIEAGVARTTLLERILRDDRPRLDAYRLAADAAARNYHVDFRIVRADGGIRWLEIHGQYERDASGKPVTLTGAAIDTTVQKQQGAQLERLVQERTEALQRLTRQQQAIINHHPDVLWIARVEPGETAETPNFVYEFFNSKLTEQTGLTVADLVGRTPQECLPRESVDLVVERYRSCVRGGIPIVYDESHTMPVGLRHYETTLVPIRDGGGEIRHIIGTARDMTDRLRLEDRLRQSEKIEAVGRLSAGVAHDFNNILQSVSGVLDLLSDELAEGTQARDLLEVAIGACGRGAYLTHHLLSYTRQQVLQPTDIVIADHLDSFLKTLRRTIGPQIEMVTDVRDRRLAIRADRAMLDTALINLAVNAAHAMGKAGRLTIRANRRRPGNTSRLPAQDYAVLTVEDTGPGIEPSVLSRVFDPFFTTKGREGTGLGLPMVQGFAHQSGGEVVLTTAVGRGTCIELWLPLGHTDAPPPRQMRTRPLSSRLSGRVLVVDDEADVLVTTGAFLRRSGLFVVTVPDAESALAHMMQAGRFDVVVSDYAMPGGNGLDLLRRVRAVWPEAGLVLITGHADVEEIMRDDGIVVLRKPFRRERLLQLVKDTLAEMGQERGVILAADNSDLDSLSSGGAAG